MVALKAKAQLVAILVPSSIVGEHPFRTQYRFQRGCVHIEVHVHKNLYLSVQIVGNLKAAGPNDVRPVRAVLEWQSPGFNGPQWMSFWSVCTTVHIFKLGRNWEYQIMLCVSIYGNETGTASPKTLLWWDRRESNPHEHYTHWDLNPARLPFRHDPMVAPRGFEPLLLT